MSSPIAQAGAVGVTCIAAVQLVKSASPTSVGPDEPFTYTIVATNNGTADAVDLVISDDLHDDLNVTGATYSVAGGAQDEPCTVDATDNTVDCGPVTLAAGGGEATVTIEVRSTADACGSVTNTATSTQSPPSNDVVVIIACPQPTPGIAVDKSADVGEAEPGDVVTYTYVIRNTGDTTLTALELDDDKIAGITIDPNLVLGPGETHTVTETYTVTQDDLDNGQVTNIAVASGQPPAGDRVTGDDTVTVPVIEIVVEDTGFLAVNKVVEGTHSGEAYAFRVDCGAASVGRDATFRLPADGGTKEVGVALPEGTRCRVVETADGGADATTVGVGDGKAASATAAIAEIQGNGAVTTVTFTNTFDIAPVVPPTEPPTTPPPGLPSTGGDSLLYLALGFAALTLGATLVAMTRPRRRRGWLHG